VREVSHESTDKRDPNLGIFEIPQPTAWAVAGSEESIVEKYLLIGGVLVALVGAVSDVRSARIPNRLTYSALLAALVLRTALLGLSGLKSGALGMLVAGGLFCFLFFLGAMGGGDMKQMAAVGAWVGSTQVVTLLLAVALAGGVLAIARMIFSNMVGQTIRNTVQLICYYFTSGLGPHPELNVQSSDSKRVPFGVAIAAGALFCVGNAVWWR
jgi:prepilin peptidase CpaA